MRSGTCIVQAMKEETAEANRFSPDGYPSPLAGEITRRGFGDQNTRLRLRPCRSVVSGAGGDARSEESTVIYQPSSLDA